MDMNQGTLKLLAQRALLGAISKQVLGICIDIQDNTLVLTVFLEGQASDAEKDALQDALSEIYGDMYPHVKGDELRLIENTTGTLVSSGMWIFLRMGNTVKDK